MLKMKEIMPSGMDPDAKPLPAQQPIDLASIRGIIERQWPLLLGAVITALLLAGAYLSTVTPQYTASSHILIDTRKNQFLRNPMVGDQPIDASTVESQIQIMRSESVALSVIRNLKLTEDPEFVDPRGNILQAAADLFGLVDQPSGDNVLERRAVSVFIRKTTARRVGLSYAIEVSFESQSPAKAAQIANAISDAYMVGELEAKYQATRRASKWLQDRIVELRDQATAADRAVQAFKADNNIVDTSRGLMNEQQLSDVNSQLIMARAVTAEAKARLDRINDINRADVPDATVTDALRNEVITRLRAQYLDLSSKEADWSSRFGANHAATVNIRNQMRELQRSIADEIRRIAETYKSDYEIARSREESLQQSLAKLVGEAGTTSQAQVQLRDLESSAQTYRSLYDNFLQKFTESTQQQDFPITEARIIKAATEPFGASAPKTSLILGTAAFVGLCFGFAGAWGREYMNRVFRTQSDVERIAGIECLGILPRIRTKEREDVQGEGAGVDGRSVARSPSIARHVIDAPFSRYAETLRNVKVSTDIARLTRDVRVIGVVSSLPKEGKTTVSSNLAHLVAQTGHRTLLIDGDLRNPSLTRLLTPNAKEGLLEILVERKTLKDVVLREPTTGLDFLPAAIKGRMSYTSELISSDAMAQLLTRARESYDYIIVDLPPVVPIVDVKAASHLIDGFVFVIEWGQSSHEIVREALSSADLVGERMLGVILNKADPNVLKRLEGYKGRHYQNYYTNEAA